MIEMFGSYENYYNSHYSLLDPTDTIKYMLGQLTDISHADCTKIFRSACQFGCVKGLNARSLHTQ
jgi:hypothetical protein